MLLNPSLTLDAHAQNIIGHVAGKVNTLSYLRNYITSKVALTIYKSTILPLLEYSNVIFSLISKKQRKKMQRLQNRALTIVYSQHGDYAAPHTCAKLASLAQRADRQLVCLMYRRATHNDHYPLVDSHGVTLSSSKTRFNIPRPKLEKFKQFPLYYGARIWDNLDLATQKSNDYEIFKMKIPKTPDFARYPVT